MKPINIQKLKKAIIFARVSTQEQFNEGCSIDAQIKLMEGYCKKNNLQVIKRFEFEESSTIKNRKKFNECLEFIENQNEKVILVYDRIDRLHQSISEVQKIDKLIKENKVELHFLDIGNLDDVSNAHQKAFFRMSAVFANFYKTELCENK